MDIEQLKNFLAAAQLGSFQRVADQQFISQRTVSKQMTSLEDELGVQLFFRGPNKITLTNAGTYFVQRATELLNQLDDSIIKLHSISQRNFQHLRTAFLATLKSRNPECQVQRVGTIEQMQTLVSLDQAIAFYPQSLPLFPSDEIVYRRLKTNGSFANQHYTVQLVARTDNNVNGLTAYRDFLVRHNR